MFPCAVYVAITHWPSASVILFLQDVKELQFGKKRHRTSQVSTGKGICQSDECRTGGAHDLERRRSDVGHKVRSSRQRCLHDNRIAIRCVTRCDSMQFLIPWSLYVLNPSGRLQHPARWFGLMSESCMDDPGPLWLPWCCQMQVAVEIPWARQVLNRCGRVSRM